MPTFITAKIRKQPTLFPIAKIRKQTQCPSTDVWVSVLSDR